MWKTGDAGSNLRIFFVCVCVRVCVEGFVHFLRIVAESPSAFPK